MTNGMGREGDSSCLKVGPAANFERILFFFSLKFNKWEVNGNKTAKRMEDVDVKADES